MIDTPALEPLDESSFQTVLCVAAHPDDLEYGTAAAIDKWVKAGKTVTYVLATSGEAGIDTMRPEQAGPVREAEERAGAALVGVEVVTFLGFRDGVVEPDLDLRRAITREIRIRRPDLLVTLTHAESFASGRVNQADHRHVGLAAIDASAAAGNRWIFPELVEEGHAPWQVGRILVIADPDSSHWVNVTGHYDAAVASLSAHEAYNEALPSDFPKTPELLQMVLGGAGTALGVEHALTGRLIG